MKKKLLAGILALALCSTNMPPQTIFAGEFTSGNPDVVSEAETPEIFTNEEQEAAGETDEELSVFSSEEIPEFNDTPDEAMAAAENAQNGVIDLTNNIAGGVYTITSAGDYKFTCSNNEPTENRIVVNGASISAQDRINIYLNNVNINTPAGPALQIADNVDAKVTIYLTGTNNLITTNQFSAGLQKNNEAQLIITSASDTTTGILKASSDGLNGAGIGGGQGNTGSNITISGGSVKAYSDRMPGIKYPPRNGNSTRVYCCIIKNEHSLPVKIDSRSWNPSDHIFPDSKKDGNLYVWLIKKENNDAYNVTVGTEKRQYSFNQAKEQFVRIQTTPTADQFDYTYHNFIYTKDTPVDIRKYIEWKDDVTGHGKITKVTYFKKGDKTPLENSPTDAGTYTFKIDVDAGEYYNSVKNISASPEWEFVISKAQAPSSKPTDTTKYVSWLCKKVEDVKGLFNDEWKWSDSDISKELPVGKEVSATAVYNGTDADNYVNTSVEFKITRKACTHPHTAERYYSSPSCTSSGYSGDTYCTDCNETLSYGYTISAYGHNYDNGVITTEPTAEIDGIITYTCKWCKHQDTKTLGKLGDGEPYIEGSFQKKGWDAINDLIKASKEKDTISITLNGAKILPASVLSEIKGKDISLNLDMENGFIWKINGTSITAETPADTDLSVTNTAEYIPAALYSLISANQNDFGFHLGRSGAFDFPAVLSIKTDASCAGLMANLFWYDVENGVLQCIQTVTVGGAFERSIPYADFTLSKGQDYFIAFGTESLNGRVIHTDGSITDENGAYLRPADAKISSHSIDRNKLTVKLSKGCAGAQGYDFVISKKSNMLQTGKFSKTVSSTGKPQASFRYLAKGTWYVAARSWVLDAQGNKVYGSWTKIKKIKITVVTPQQPKIRNITVKGNTVTITYTKCKNAIGYEILLGNKYKTSAGEKYPVKKYVKRTEGKNTVTVAFTNLKKGTWYVTVRSWNKTSKDKSRVYSPYSTMKKFKTKK